MRHVIYIAIGFPPAAKSCAYRMKATANLLCEQGCDVTVVTISATSWRREYGLDYSLIEDLNPRVSVVELDLSRVDIDPDVRTYGWFRARYPKQWMKIRRFREQIPFPEPVFGCWRRQLERAVLDIHREKPADLLLVSTVPYTGLAAAWKLFRSHAVPFAIDFRDAWSRDVIKGDDAFPARSRRGRWEAKIVENAHRVWCVNEPIRHHYATRYPQVADRMRVVPNGSDLPPTDAGRRPDPANGLTFGYLGTAVFPIHYLTNVLKGWRIARTNDPVVARSRLEFRGHFGWQSADMTDSRRSVIGRAAEDSVVFRGPVARSAVPETYAEWDALVFLITGGRYMTSGKVFEYVSTGLPIMSVHEPEHGAEQVLSGYPLWVPPPAKITANLIAESFIKTAHMALTATDDQRSAALAHAQRYQRRPLAIGAVRELVESLGEIGLMAPDESRRVTAGASS